MKKFEHKIIMAQPKSKWMGQIDLDANENILVGLGLEGWELVSILSQTNNKFLGDTFLSRV